MARLICPPLRVIDFVGGLRLVGEGSSRDRLFASMARFMGLLTRAGAHFHTRKGKRRWLARPIPWIEFVANMKVRAVEIKPRERRHGMTLCEEITCLQIRSTTSARLVRTAASSLNSLQWVVPGGFRDLRSGWNVVTASGFMDKWRGGARRAVSAVRVKNELRNDMH